MKHLIPILFILFVFLPNNVMSQNDSILFDRIQELQLKINKLENSVNRNQRSILISSDEIDSLQGLLRTQEENSDLLQNKLINLTDSLSFVVKEAEASNNIKKKELANSIFIIRVTIVCIFILIALILLYFGLKNKKLHKLINDKDFSNKINEIKEYQIKIDNKQIELLELQMKLQKEKQSLVSNSAEIDHSMVLDIANEIIRLETNLSRMDSSIRGYKQLSSAIRRMKDSLKAADYEIVDFIGKPYNEGMRVIADFITDENLSPGENIITSVAKPQVNYKGLMIQKARITVSQN